MCYVASQILQTGRMPVLLFNQHPITNAVAAPTLNVFKQIPSTYDSRHAQM